MDILQSMGIDPHKAQDGVWIRLKDDQPIDESEIGTLPAVKIARADNLQHRKALTKRLTPLLARRRRGELELELQEQIQAESIYGTVILDWRNLEAGGEPFPCTAANVTMVWTDIRFAEFKSALEGLVSRQDLFRLENQEERLKN